MYVISNIEEIQSYLNEQAHRGKTIGFTPTMGALHDGHMSLLITSKEQCDVSVVSIFVNPTQFNNPSDLENYPRRMEEDLALLEKNGCDVVFTPSEEAIYPENFKGVSMDLSIVNEEMEGTFRPGHFQGVVNVVFRFFEILRPSKAYFGLKDFQQVTIIKIMVDKLELPTEVVGCETLRAENGLAMSSRNYRLNDKQLAEASAIFKTLEYGKSLVKDNTPAEAQEKMKTYFDQFPLDLEYLQIVNTNTLEKLNSKWSESATCCIAAYFDDVRLIDNMEIA